MMAHLKRLPSTVKACSDPDILARPLVPMAHLERHTSVKACSDHIIIARLWVPTIAHLMPQLCDELMLCDGRLSLLSAPAAMLSHPSWQTPPPKLRATMMPRLLRLFLVKASLELSPPLLRLWAPVMSHLCLSTDLRGLRLL
jgi:hypothetical protein